MSGRTHVVILAAGRGSRLGESGDEVPKWLLEVGGSPIADRHLEAVEIARGRTSGIASVHVVTGHAGEEIEGYLAGRAPEVEVMPNPHFFGLNNWYSVLLALRDLMHDPEARVVVVNSDLFARPEWMGAFLADAATTGSESLIAVDLERELTDESMKVVTDGPAPGRVALIGKKGVGEAQGEYVGMLMARGSVLRAFRSRLEAFVGRDEHADEWYERAVGLTAAHGSEWAVWPTPDGRWVEIDDAADHRLANDLVEAV